MPLKKIGEHITDLKGWVSGVLSVLVTLGAVYSQLDVLAQEASEVFVDKVSKTMYAEVTVPAYVIVENDLIKQLEKLATDPDNVKDTDIQKFKYFCNDDPYFTGTWAESSEQSRGIRIACEKVLEAYDKRYGL